MVSDVRCSSQWVRGPGQGEGWVVSVGITMAWSRVCVYLTLGVLLTRIRSKRGTGSEASAAAAAAVDGARALPRWKLALGTQQSESW